MPLSKDCGNKRAPICHKLNPDWVGKKPARVLTQFLKRSLALWAVIFGPSS